LVLLAVDSHPHAFLNISRGEFIAEFDHEFGDLLEVDDVLLLVPLLDDFVAPGNLQRLLCGLLGILCEIPLSGE
jgi:hypothetical protein